MKTKIIIEALLGSIFWISMAYYTPLFVGLGYTLIKGIPKGRKNKKYIMVFGEFPVRNFYPKGMYEEKLLFFFVGVYLFSAMLCRFLLIFLS